MSTLKHDWTKEEILAIYNQPMMDLLYQAASVHREQHNPNQVQVSTLLSIKTGGCPEDCGYCPQAARYHTDIEGTMRAMRTVCHSIPPPVATTESVTLEPLAQIICTREVKYITICGRWMCAGLRFRAM